jgi:hypothetical protein
VKTSTEENMDSQKKTGSEQGTNHDIKATSPNGLTAEKIHDKPDRKEHQLAIMHKLCFQVPTALWCDHRFGEKGISHPNKQKIQSKPRGY